MILITHSKVQQSFCKSIFKSTFMSNHHTIIIHRFTHLGMADWHICENVRVSLKINKYRYLGKHQ